MIGLAEDKRLKVSVCMIAYNHEAFIAQAVESVMMQETTFDYELVIGEDCSTDRTREIVKDLQKKYPDKIRLLLPETNLRMLPNFIQTLQSCQGEYVALLEGDDYWTSPYKLQKQVAFLDEHPGYSACFHNAYRQSQDAEMTELHCPVSQKPSLDTRDLLLENPIPTCSVMFRRTINTELPDWFYSLKMGDWPLHILNSLYGPIGYLDEVMGVYRIHIGGAWSRLQTTARVEAIVALFEKLDTHLVSPHKAFVRMSLAERYFYLSTLYTNANDLGAAREYTKRFFRSHAICRPAVYRQLPRHLLSVYAPVVYKMLRRIAKPGGVAPQV